MPLVNAVAPGRLALRALIGLGAAALLVWLVVPITVAGIFRERLPGAALDVERAMGAPLDARAMATRAKQELADGRESRRLGNALAQATAALRRDPTVVDAAVVIGLTHALRGDPGRAERAFLYADRLSRRDIGAQLWLIERAVQRNDISEALRHYDTVLRVSPPLASQLFPVLSEASRVPEIAIALNGLLRTRPNWGNDFLSFLLRGQSDPRAAFLVSRGLVSPGDPREREHLVLLLRSLTSSRAFDLAWRAYVTAWPSRAQGNVLLWNGDFSSDLGVPPFDWSYAEDPALAAERRARPGGNFALYLPTGANTEADAARQLVRLAPGAYQLTGTAGGVADDPDTRPFVIIACEGMRAPVLASQDLPVSPDSGRRFALRFTVPAGCPQQWVTIRVRGDFDRQASAAAWVDTLAIARN